MHTPTDNPMRSSVEQEWRESEVRYRLALVAGRMGSWETDIVAGTRVWSEEGMALFGLALEGGRGHVGGAADEYAAAIHPDDRHHVPHLHALADAVDSFPAAYRIVRSDGRTLWLEGRGLVIARQLDGRAHRLVSIMADVTERKQAEQALRDADRNKDRFIAMLAHELRNPLAPIRNALGVLRQEAAAGERVSWCRGVIERQVAQMAHLLDDLLDVSRISGGRLQLRPSRIRMSDVIAHAVEIARPLVDAFGHTLTVDAVPADHWLDGDLTRLAQVFSNLLINAAKYTPAGGRIDVRFRVDGAVIETNVADTGIGIAPELLPEVFDLFGRARASPLERPESGLGLGLSLSRSLVEMHGGNIEARSGGVGSGSEFVVRLPLAAVVRPTAETSDSASAAAPPAASGARRRVLVADDLRDSADSLGLLIESMGHEVHVAYDGAAALDVAERVRPEVALLDLGMPELDGYEVCRRIRSTAWGEPMTLIAQTGWGRDDDRARTREAGFDHHIVKPVDPAALEALLLSLPTRAA